MLKRSGRSEPILVKLERILSPKDILGSELVPGGQNYIFGNCEGVLRNTREIFGRSDTALVATILLDLTG